MQTYAEQLMAEFQRTREQAAELRERLRTVTATVTSPDSLVTATVGPRGQLLRLDIDPRVYRRPNSRVLADAITTTVQRATVAAAAKVTELCQPGPPLPAEHLDAALGPTDAEHAAIEGEWAAIDAYDAFIRSGEFADYDGYSDPLGPAARLAP
jgi:DNA-binding protein YbaB